MQLGTCQPIDRLHSDHADRLPWEYGAEAEASATRFLRLREALVPYTYTAARQANTTGVPIVRPTYLDKLAVTSAHTIALRGSAPPIRRPHRSSASVESLSARGPWCCLLCLSSGVSALHGSG